MSDTEIEPHGRRNMTESGPARCFRSTCKAPPSFLEVICWCDMDGGPGQQHNPTPDAPLPDPSAPERSGA